MAALGTHTTDVPVALPGTLRQAVRQEFHRAFRPPYENFITVAVNGALMSSCWFLLPEDLRNQIFTLHGSLAYALVLASWMYSDVPATNVLGPDAARVAAAIDDPAMLRRLLYAKNINLWLLVTPVCSIVAVSTGLYEGDMLAAFFTLVWIGVVPFGTLAISAWVGILFPYHPMPLRYRWAHHRPWWRKVGRWLALAVTPYMLCPAIAVVLMAPSLLLWGIFSEHGLTQRLPDQDLGWGVAVACAVALAASLGGQRIGVAMARRRRDRLLALLADPAWG